MNDIQRIVTNSRRGRAVIYNGMVFLGGQVAGDRSDEIRVQTEQVFAKIDKVLADAGSDKSRILSAQIWLKDIARDFSAMNEAWDAWMPTECAPSRATAQCEMGAPDVLIEIIVTAALMSPTTS